VAEDTDIIRRRAVSAVQQRSQPVRSFTKMSINELKLHEKGILNLFESQQAVAKMNSHNKQMGDAHNIKNQDPNIFESKLS
jgi:hypothetical protein